MTIDTALEFRPSHSCQAQLISIVELQLPLDCHHQVDLLMLDFSKAFDTVSHQHASIKEIDILWN